LNGGGDVSTVVEIIIVIYTKNEMENGKLKRRLVEEQMLLYSQLEVVVICKKIEMVNLTII